MLNAICGSFLSQHCFFSEEPAFKPLESSGILWNPLDMDPSVWPPGQRVLRTKVFPLSLRKCHSLTTWKAAPGGHLGKRTAAFGGQILQVSHLKKTWDLGETQKSKRSIICLEGR